MTQIATNPVGSPSPFVLEFTLQAEDFKSEWTRCNLLANYIAEYTAYQFTQRERAENLISTIANEMLEAAVTLTQDDSAVSINIKQGEHGLEVHACYKIHSELVTPYQDFINMLEKTSQKIYFDLLTQKSLPEQHFNQLGLVMLTHDFGAQITIYPLQDSDQICTKILISNEEFSA